MTKYMFRYLFILLYIPFILSGQDKTVDSLNFALKNAKKDITRCDILTQLIDNEYDENVWIEYNKELEKIAKKNLVNLSKTDSEFKNYKKHLSTSLNNYGYFFLSKGEINKAINYYNQSINIDKEIGNINGIANNYGNLGAIYRDKGETNKALVTFLEGLKLFKTTKDSTGIDNLLRNIGSLYSSMGNISEALNYYKRVIHIDATTGNKGSEAYTLMDIARLYSSQDEIQKALDYNDKSFKLMELIGDKVGASDVLDNIGGIYFKQKDYKKAKVYYSKSLALRRKAGNKEKIAGSLYALSSVLITESNYDESLKYSEESLKLFEELENKHGMAFALSGIGQVYLEQNKLDKAEKYLKKCLEISLEIGYPIGILNISEGLTKLYTAKGNYKLAFENYKLYIKMRDSLNNIETQKATIKQQTQYEYNKQKAIEDKEHELQLKQQAEKAKDEKIKQNIIILSVSLILIIVIIFSIFLYKRIKVTQQQKAVIELKEKETQSQKHIIEEKHKEITDSINYAERIQRSFLATKEILDTNLGDYFVLFKPKDVVSGDFYWASKLNNGRFALVTADSTGHGVPGAIMSLLNITSLEKAIETLIEPSEILNATRKTIIERLKKDGSEHGGKDGMDASLTVYDFANNKLVIAAANNPVWIVRRVTSSSDEGVLRQAQDKLNREVKTDNSSRYEQSSTRTDNFEVIEIKPDKMPVGKHDKDSISFAQHELDLQKGDVVYTLTDGFPDQFGGEKGKKFMSKNLRELLAANAHLPMHEQKQLLEKTFSDWVGNLEQVDDVTIIGVRV